MSEFEPAAGPDTASDPSPSAGALLRQAREAAGIHIATLAVSLKVPVKKMEALEQDRYDLLPDAVFVRALASSVCRILKIDPAEVLARLPQTGAQRFVAPAPSINTPFRPAGEAQGPSSLAVLRRPAVMIGAALLLGALVLVFLPNLRDLLPDAARAVSAVRDAATPAPTPGPSSMTDPAVVGAAGSDSTPVAAVEPMPPASAATAAGVAGTAPSTPMPVIVSGPSQAAVPPQAAASVAGGATAASTGLVVFRAKADSWIQVTDAKGATTLRKMLKGGEVANAAGVPPLAVVVGRADSTEVEVRGKVMDLSLLSRDNVARFEVK